MATMVSGAALKTIASTAVNSQIRGYKERRAEAKSQVDWEDYNYPPYLRVLHYNLDDVEDVNARFAVRIAHLSYLMACSTFCVNCFGTFVLACGGLKLKGVHLIYAIFNLIIYSIVGMYAFYKAYKGLATKNGRLTDYYLGLQVLFIIFFFIASIVGGANYYGWTNVKRASESDELSGVWVFWTFFESIMWTIDYLVGGWALYLVAKNKTDKIGGLLGF